LNARNDTTGGAGILKQTITQATKSYQPKHIMALKKKAAAARGAMQHSGAMGLEDPPPITEDDINKGMISLLNKGIIPKDVDLTPAFEKGAPPVTCKGVRFYAKEEKNLKRDVQVGGT
jgi:hypothetical protein